jgi:hypothetical protein
MFELIVFREEPFLRGIETFSCSVRTDREPSALGCVQTLGCEPPFNNRYVRS